MTPDLAAMRARYKPLYFTRMDGSQGRELRPGRPDVLALIDAHEALLAERRAPTDVHHQGVWKVDSVSGECGCECAACFRDDTFFCFSCTFNHDHHDHGPRDDLRRALPEGETP